MAPVVFLIEIDFLLISSSDERDDYSEFNIYYIFFRLILIFFFGFRKITLSCFMCVYLFSDAKRVFLLRNFMPV